MASKNVKTIQAQNEAFNNRDEEGALAPYGDDVTVLDHGAGQTLKSREEVRELFAGYLGMASDLKLTIDNIIDAGDTVVVQFVVNGTNDGPFGPFAATGKRIDVPVGEIFKFDKKGKIIQDDIYWDQLTLLTQLGHMKPPS
jgi:steroid delta-isomerase-like uncharacterized protein